MGTRVPNKRCVRVREGGKVLEAIDLDLLLHLRARPRRENPLFLIATEWNGPANMLKGSRTGQVLTVQAPAPAAGGRRNCTLPAPAYM